MKKLNVKLIKHFSFGRKTANQCRRFCKSNLALVGLVHLQAESEGNKARGSQENLQWEPSPRLLRPAPTTFMHFLSHIQGKLLNNRVTRNKALSC